MGGDLDLKFGLPPSLGREPSWERARDLAALLDDVGFQTVIPFASYEELERQLFSGEIDAAWAPPMVCARVETAGGVIALRGIRGVDRTYRSAIVARTQDVFGVDAIGRSFRPRAAWVARTSVGGYLLARAHLRRLGVDVGRAFLQEEMLGSYAACIDALLGFDTDLIALFVGKLGLEPIWGPKARRLKVLAYTDDVPNDGVAISPSLLPDRAAQVVRRLSELLEAAEKHRQLTSLLQVDDFDRPPPGTYAPVLRLV